MTGSFISPPAKRSYHNLITTTTNTLPDPYNPSNGASKRRSKPPPPPLSIPAGHVSLRLLCHVNKIGGVIGKSGSVVKLFRQETGAKIRVEEYVSDCEERVILIVAPENPKKTLIIKGEDDSEGEEHELSPAQEALVKVFERVLDVESEIVSVFPPPGGQVSCRLLAETSQVGGVMGKGGKVIEKIRKESGAKIKVIGSEQIPACASYGDEVISIMGDVMSVKKALIAVSCCLQDNQPTDKGQIGGSRPVERDPYGTFPDTHVELSHRSSFKPPPLANSVDYGSRAHPLPTEVDRISTLDPKKLEEVAFRLLCSNDTVGGIIGKGGTIVKALQNETGAKISVASTVSEGDDRVITVSAMENPDSRESPARIALVRVFNRSVQAAIEKGLNAGSNKNSSVSARLLIQPNQVGCLMGKGGSIISEMRKMTGTGIRIITSDKAPKSSSEKDEVVQIVGELRNVEDALFHIAGRLRDNLLPNKTLNSTGAGGYSSLTFPEVSPYGRVREPTSPGQYHPSVGFSHNIDRQNTLTHSMDHLGLSHGFDRPPSPQPWTSQPLGGVNSRNTDFGRGLTTLRGGSDFGSGGKSAIVTNTTVEILVPEQVIGSVIGENGSNLSRLRQISRAKVSVERSGLGDTMVIISGTPDQTQAAQSLLQAFILSGQSSPDHRQRHL